ncbi:MAG: transposase family protein [Verrucomicrobiota bacterium]
MPETRSAEGLRHKQATILCLVLLALMCGVTGGYADLEEFAQRLNQGQRRRLRCWRNPHTGRYDVPDETTFFRVLKALDLVPLGQLLVQWETDRCGWAAGGLLGIDGKAVRHGGQHLLGAGSKTHGTKPSSSIFSLRQYDQSDFAATMRCRGGR